MITLLPMTPREVRDEQIAKMKFKAEQARREALEEGSQAGELGETPKGTSGADQVPPTESTNPISPSNTNTTTSTPCNSIGSAKEKEKE